MSTLAEKAAAFAAARGAMLTVERSGEEGGSGYDSSNDTWTDNAGASWTSPAFPADPGADDEFRADSLTLVDPVSVALPNDPRVTFPPAPGMRMVWMGQPATIRKIKDRTLDGAVLSWRILGEGGI